MNSVAGGGKPPDDIEMDRRLTVLETRFDTLLPTLATKADVAAMGAEVRVELEKLRAEFTKALTEVVKWMIGIMVSLFIATIGINITLFSALKAIVSNKPAITDIAQPRVPLVTTPEAPH
jgi:hypothetical protein